MQRTWGKKRAPHLSDSWDEDRVGIVVATGSLCEALRPRGHMCHSAGPHTRVYSIPRLGSVQSRFQS